MVNWDGDVERIVSIIVIHLSCQDGRVLAQLGTWGGTSVRASCRLPGKKLLEGEMPAQALARVLHDTFAPFVQSITCTGVEQK